MRNQWVLSLSYRWVGWWRSFVAAGWSRTLVIVAAVGLAAFLFPATLVFFLVGYNHISGTVVSEASAMVVIVELTSLVGLLGAVTISFMSAARFFDSVEPNLVIAWPWQPDSLLLDRLMRVVGRAVWPLLFVTWPALIVVGWQIGAVWVFQLFALCAVLLLLAVGVGLGLSARFLLSLLSQRRPAWVAGVLGGLALVVVMFLVISAAIATIGENGSVIVWWRRPLHDLAVVAVGLRAPLVLSAHSGLWFWPVTAAGSWWLALWLAGLSQRFWWQAETPSPRPVRSGGFRLWPRFMAPRHVFLFERETLNLMRDAAALSRLLWLGLLVVAGLLILRLFLPALSVNRPIVTAEAAAWVVFGLGAAALIAALDRCFPALTTAMRESWLTRVSPMHLHELYSWKLFFWCAVFGLPSLLLAIVVAYWLALPAAVAFIFPILVSGTVITITALSLGQGFVFCPAPDSGRLATSGGRRHRPIDVPAGWATVIIGLGYLAITWRYARTLFGWFLVTGEIDGSSLVGWLVVSLSIVFFYWWLAPQRLELDEGCR